MQASRTAHYAWLYRGGSRGQAQGWPHEVAPKQPGASTLRQRVSPLSRGAGRSNGNPNELSVEGNMSAAAARAHFIEAQINDAVESGIQQMVWLGPRVAQAAVRGAAPPQPERAERGERGERVEQGVEVEVFRLEADSLRIGGARAVLDRSLVRSARTLFVCDGLLDRAPSAQIQAILRMIGDSCYGSRLAFVYLESGSVSGHVSSSGSQKPRCAVPRLGEPTHAGIEKRALPALLAGAGLVLDADMGLSEYVRRVLGEVPSDLRGYSCWRLAVAHVRAPAPTPLDVDVDIDSGPLN